jgi:hypothetical protein
MQDTIDELLRDVVRGFRRQRLQLAAGEQFPFPIYRLSPGPSAPSCSRSATTNSMSSHGA